MASVGGVRIDLNADLGEGFGIWRLGDDDGLLDVVTSANVACGFHAGDPVTMRRICERAVARGVAIGAQVGYRDLAGFGRRRMDVAPGELSADVVYQLGALDAFARLAGDRVRYVKPHGALYNTAAEDEIQAAAIAVAVAAYDPALAILGLAGSALDRAAVDNGLAFVGEFFADRAYTSSGRLVSRTRPGAVIDHPDLAAARAVDAVVHHMVIAEEGTAVAVDAQSICVHGDTAGAVALAGTVRLALIEAGVAVQPFSYP